MNILRRSWVRALINCARIATASVTVVASVTVGAPAAAGQSVTTPTSTLSGLTGTPTQAPSAVATQTASLSTVVSGYVPSVTVTAVPIMGQTGAPSTATPTQSTPVPTPGTTAEPPLRVTVGVSTSLTTPLAQRVVPQPASHTLIPAGPRYVPPATPRGSTVQGPPEPVLPLETPVSPMDVDRTIALPFDPTIASNPDWGGQLGPVGERYVRKSQTESDPATVDPEITLILVELARMSDVGLFDEHRNRAMDRAASERVIDERSRLPEISPSMFGRIVAVLEGIRAGTVVGAPIGQDQARRLTYLIRGGPDAFAKALSRFAGVPGGAVAGPDDFSTDALFVDPTTLRVLAEFARRESGYEHGPLADREVSRVIEHIEGLAFRADTSASGPEDPRLINELLRIGRAGRVFERPDPRVTRVLEAITELSRGSTSLWDVSPDVREALVALAHVGAGHLQGAGDRKSVQFAPTNAPGAAGQISARAVAGTGFGPFTSVASGSDHTCALGQDGQVSCWGQSVWRQNGQTLSTNSPVSVPMPDGITFDRLVAGGSHRCGLTVAGIAYCWGADSAGRLGSDVKNYGIEQAPVAVSGGLTFSELVAGSSHTCGLTSTGAAYCWGQNYFGQLGTGDRSNRSEPALVTGSQTFTTLATGSNTTCGISSDSSIWCWGQRGYVFYDSTASDSLVPVSVAIGPGISFTRLKLGSGFACGLTGAGKLYCWGSNSYGQLGDGTTTTRSVPVAVVLPPSARVVELSLGSGHACAITDGGVGYCWGEARWGTIGDWTRGWGRPTPTQVSLSDASKFGFISAGSSHTCAVSTAGAAYCWGSNGSGQLGNGVASTSPLPVAVAKPAGVRFVELAGGNVHSCALTTSGTVMCWGGNLGQLGDGTTTPRATPVAAGLPSGVTLTSLASNNSSYGTCGIANNGDVYCWGSTANTGSQVPTKLRMPLGIMVPTGSGFSGISVGGSHVCGLAASGIASCWGRNYSGELGNGTTQDSEVAVQVSGAFVFTSLASGVGHTCGATLAGAVWCWGDNSSSQLGDGSTTNRPTPVEVLGLPAMSSLTAGSYHTCGITLAGAAWCWGSNNRGQIGDGTNSNRTTPVAVFMPNGSVFASVKAGYRHTCGLSTSGDAYCWGTNDYGQLGDGTTTQRTVATRVVLPAGVALSAISPGGFHTCALTQSGDAYCWGDATSGQLGNGPDYAPVYPYPVAGQVPVPAIPSPPTPIATVVPTVAPVLGRFTTINAGLSHTCGLNETGNAFCWGSNTSGQLGDGTTTTRSMPVAVSGGLTFASLATGSSHTCGLVSGGAAYCWGQGSSQLGNGLSTYAPVTGPVAVSGGMTFTRLVAGSSHTCGLATGGTAYCWGQNFYGQLGDGTTTSQSIPVAVSVGRTFTDLAAAYSHTCGLVSGGTAYCWGYNSSGQLGDGTTTNRNSPLVVSGGLAFTRIIAAYSHTCGLTTGGSAYCWGDNWNGKIGDGTATQQKSPVAVSGGLSFTSLAAGDYHTCGLTARGTRYCWGSNYYGQFGDGTNTSRTTPGLMADGRVFATVVAGSSHTCGLELGGMAYCWGRDTNGQLGIGSSAIATVPVTVATETGVRLTKVSNGESHSCGITTSGAVVCWGYNGYGQLGDGATVTRTSPTTVQIPFWLVPPTGSGFSNIVTGSVHSCGLTFDGQAFCWGHNSSGQLGDGTTTQRTLATRVSLPAGVSLAAISAGTYYTCGVATSGDAYCWGDNSGGQLGDGTTTQKTVATRVSLPDGVSLVRISASSDYWPHTCGVATSGDAYCWGTNDSGQLGDGTTTRRTVPTRVPAPSGVAFSEIVTGSNHTCALTTVGVAACWGQNYSGQLGDGTPSSSMFPIAVAVSSGMRFARIAAGGNTTCGIASTGAAYCWGSNSSGQLGDGSTVNRSLPVAVSPAKDLLVDEIAVGATHACAITTTGVTVCWGDNSMGQLGDGIVLARNAPAFVVGQASAPIVVTPSPTATPITGVGAVPFAELATGSSHSCGRTTSGGVVCWGSNWSGQLGDGTTVSRSSPAPVGLPTGTSVTSMRAGGGHTCALTSSGYVSCWGSSYANSPVAITIPNGAAAKVIATGANHACAISMETTYCWGSNDAGQLGNGSASNSYVTPFVPVAIGSSPAMVTLAGGNSHTCGLTAQGSAYCWGSNTYGQLGDGSTTQRASPVPVLMPAGVAFSAVSSGRYHTCALATSGEGYCWGQNSGQLGDGTYTTRLVPVRVLLPHGVVLSSIGAGSSHTCAVATSGLAYCWGQNSSGQLADGTTVSQTAPQVVPAAPGFRFAAIASSMGSSHTCALSDVGSAYCWGNDESGQLGDGVGIARSAPYVVARPPAGNITSLSAGAQHNCGATSTGLAYCWGQNYGQLGDGTQVTRALPTAVSPPFAVDFSLKQLSTGNRHSCGLSNEGQTYCWGQNYYGQIGDGTTTYRSNGVQVLLPLGIQLRSLAAADFVSCGVAVNGDSYCWGQNSYGQLGDGTTTDRSVPTRVLMPADVKLQVVRSGGFQTCGLDTDGGVWCWGKLAGNYSNRTFVPTKLSVPAGITFASVATGANHACAVTSSGVATCWGQNTSGQLGIGSTGSTDVPIPVRVPTTTGFKMLSAGATTTCGLSADGEAWCWGANASGQLGDGTKIDRTTPVKVILPVGTTLESVQVGGSHVCGVMTGGGVLCWGSNESRQLGDGTPAYQAKPVLVIGQQDTTPFPLPVVTLAPALGTFASVATGSSTACGTNASGVAFCWGRNGSGQVGDGTTTSRSAPVAVKVASGLTMASLAVAGYHSCGLTPSGQATCWGNNSNGELGDGTTASRSTPVAVVSPSGTTYSRLTVGGAFTCVQTVTGAVQCWGNNAYGQVGDGTSGTNRVVPASVTFPETVNATQITAGGIHACALASTGTVYCWGANSSGQIGDGTSGSGINRLAPVRVSSADGLQFSAVAAGASHSCAIASDGRAFCWGLNGSGQLGTGVAGDVVASPTAVDMPEGVSFTSIHAGGSTTCARTSAGDLWCWGQNATGQIGDGITTDRARPTRVLVGGGAPVRSVSVGQGFACAITTGSATYCWGNNTDGQLGDGRESIRAVPGAIQNPGTVAFDSLALGADHSCGIDRTGGARCWGSNVSGQLGDGTWTPRSAPVQVSVPQGTLLSKLAAGYLHTCAVSSTGRVWCWGSNSFGQLGDGTSLTRYTPLEAAQPGGLVFADVVAGWYFSCGIASAGDAWCWGSNENGQLGNGSSGTQQVAPVAVSMPTGVAFTRVTAGYRHACALTGAGAAWCWGYNSSGQLGIGTSGTDQPSPVAVTMPAGVVFTDLVASNYGTCALSSSRGVWCWGSMGTYSTTPSLVPVPASVGFAMIGSGMSHACGITTSGITGCWGSTNSSGQLGDGTTINHSSPMAVTLPMGTTLSRVTGGSRHTCGLTADGDVWCWGDNGSGQLGDGAIVYRSSPVLLSGQTIPVTPSPSPVPGTATPAIPTETPVLPVARSIRTSNVASRTFTVTWATDVESAGRVRWAADGNPGTAPATIVQDVRGATASSFVHLVTVDGLTPSSRYLFDVVSGESVDSNSGQHYSVTTSSLIGGGSADLVGGSVSRRDGKLPASAVVSIVASGNGTISESYPVSTLVTAAGPAGWQLDLAKFVTRSGDGLFPMDSSTVLTVVADGGPDGVATSIVTVGELRRSALSLVLSNETRVSLGYGWNLIALEAHPKPGLTASSICTSANAASPGSVVEVDRWVNGGWEAHMCAFPPNDFPLIVGAGYFIRAVRPTSWTYGGAAPIVPAAMTLDAGWNLVGPAVQSGSPGAASSVCTAGDANSGPKTVLELSRWVAGGWESHWCGVPPNNFTLGAGSGYFIRLSRASLLTLVGSAPVRSASVGMSPMPIPLLTATSTATRTPTLTPTSTLTVAPTSTPTVVVMASVTTATSTPILGATVHTTESPTVLPSISTPPLVVTTAETSTSASTATIVLQPDRASAVQATRTL